MKVYKIIPYTPYYKADGNTVILEWEEFFVDRSGNKAVLTKVLFETKKKIQSEAVIRVKWL